MNDLTKAAGIVIHRVENGWIVREGPKLPGKEITDMPLFVFNSTASLCKNLPDLIGQSGWEIKPLRDDKGHFKPKVTNAIPPVIFKQP